MTIKQDKDTVKWKNPIDLQIEFQKLLEGIWFYTAIIGPLIVFVALLTVPLDIKVTLKIYGLVTALYLISLTFYSAHKNKEYKKVLFIMSLSIVIANAFMIGDYKDELLIQEIKKSKPTLTTTFSKCSKKENVILDDYQLIRERGNYYIIPWEEDRKIDLDDVEKYDYEVIK